MNEIEQAAKEYAEKWKTQVSSERMEMIQYDFTAGAEFYKTALSQKFEGLREEFMNEFAANDKNCDPELWLASPDSVYQWFKRNLLK